MHSPVIPGESLWSIGRQTVGSIRKCHQDAELTERIGRDLPSDALERFIEPLSEETRAKVLGANVKRIYGLGLE